MCGIVIVFAACVVTGFSLQPRDDAKTKKSIEQLQQRYFDLILQKKYSELDAILAPEYLGTYRGGIIDRAKESSDLRQFPLAEYKITDSRVVLLDKKTAINVFHVHVRVHVDGKDFFEDDNINCLWRKDGKMWRLVSQTAVKTEDAPKQN